MIEFYPQIKLVHVIAVVSSGGLFLLRALAVQGRQLWAMAAPIRYLSYTVDTVLLTAALMLMTVLHQFPFVNSWLTAKVPLVVLYIVLASFGLKRAPTRRSRLICTIAACLVYGWIVSIARTHNPLGVLAWLN
ncbi:MAG: SirB2 family protein [Gammaproteobacteria bacterium]